MSAQGCVLSKKPPMSEAFFVVFLMNGAQLSAASAPAYRLPAPHLFLANWYI